MLGRVAHILRAPRARLPAKTAAYPRYGRAHPDRATLYVSSGCTSERSSDPRQSLSTLPGVRDAFPPNVRSEQEGSTLGAANLPAHSILFRDPNVCSGGSSQRPAGVSLHINRECIQTASHRPMPHTPLITRSLALNSHDSGRFTSSSQPQYRRK